MINITSAQGIIKLQISAYTLLDTREPNHTSYKSIGVQTLPVSLLTGVKKGLAAASDFLSSLLLVNGEFLH